MNRPKRRRSYRSHINLAPMDFEVRQDFIKTAMAFGGPPRAGVDGPEIIVEVSHGPHEKLIDDRDADLSTFSLLVGYSSDARVSAKVPLDRAVPSVVSSCGGRSIVSGASQGRVRGPAP